jgi:hypothetical protein
MTADPRDRARAETDRVLAMLDNATQRTQTPTQSFDSFVGLYDDPEVCWRCMAAPPAGDLGVCDPCLTVLRSEETPAPAEGGSRDRVQAYMEQIVSQSHYAPTWANRGRDIRTPDQMAYAALGFPIDAWTSPAYGICRWDGDGRFIPLILMPPQAGYEQWGSCTIADHQLPIGQTEGAHSNVGQYRWRRRWLVMSNPGGSAEWLRRADVEVDAAGHWEPTPEGEPPSLTALVAHYIDWMLEHRDAADADMLRHRVAMMAEARLLVMVQQPRSLTDLHGA